MAEYAIRPTATVERALTVVFTLPIIIYRWSGLML